LAPTSYPIPGFAKREWLRVQLDPVNTLGSLDDPNTPLLPPGKSEIDVAADYLHMLQKLMTLQLQKFYGTDLRSVREDCQYCLTIPHLWNDAAKAATRAAAIQAGIVSDDNDNRLHLISNSEAAAIYCLKTNLIQLDQGGVVLVVDCGSGVVQMTALLLEDTDAIDFSECTSPTGCACGSTAMSRNFSNILLAKIQEMKLPDTSHTADKVYADCMMDFENRIKSDFRNNGQRWAVDVGIEAEFPKADLEEGYMLFTNEEILQCFDPVVTKILEMMDNQVAAIEAQDRKLQVLILDSKLNY
jgi:hypothetical protein